MNNRREQATEEWQRRYAIRAGIEATPPDRDTPALPRTQRHRSHPLVRPVLLWRVPANRVLPVERTLRDGSWLSRIHACTDAARSDPVTVRVVAYRLDGTGRAAGEYRLVTSLLDARHSPARRLAALYRERWEAEAVFAELKTCLRGPRTVLSSKTPDGVRLYFTLPEGGKTHAVDMYFSVACGLGGHSKNVSGRVGGVAMGAR
ncbi:transposase [Streptomyces sp. NPDC059788]|uniref:transposase n=1 Tax=Streptomyces sp. NPDC059788 TaxID=3346948 RepID=UPI0036593F5B